MELLHGLMLITSIHLLAAASPGPDFVFISRQTLALGKRYGLLTALGVTLGLSVHIAYSSLGVAAVILKTPAMLDSIKLLAGIYLIWLGTQGLRSHNRIQLSTNGDEQAAHSAMKTIAAGFMCNALNPKAPVYFLSLFTLVLSPQMPWQELLIYSGWMMLIQLGWFALVVYLLSAERFHSWIQGYGYRIDQLLGGVLLVMGTRVLFSLVPQGVI